MLLPSRTRLICACTLLSLGLLAPGSCGDPISLTLTPVAGPLTKPTFVAAPAGDPRLFLVLREGRIRIIENGVIAPTPFLDISDRTAAPSFSEQGLLGLAFPPDYAATGQFYVYYTDTSGDSQLSRFLTTDGDPAADTADAESEVPLLSVAQPRANHNGGTVAFGPADGMLYWGLGDGGGANDETMNAQDPLTLLGSILRLDVSGGAQSGAVIPPDNPFVDDATHRDEIWAYGLRNPYRFGFDRETGEMWIGDVGQGSFEEVNREPPACIDDQTPAADGCSVGGRNYGWVVHEGNSCHRPQDVTGAVCETPATASVYTFPVHDYAHGGDQGCKGAVTGGTVYRGLIPQLAGQYLFADFCQLETWSLDPGTLATTTLTAQIQPVNGIVGIGEDGYGEMYLVDFNFFTNAGSVWRVTSTESDADGDGAPDSVDSCPNAANGPVIPDAGARSQYDADGDGHGNACDGDFNQDDFVGGPDFDVFLQCFNRDVGGGGGPADDPDCAESDLNGDDFVGGPDFDLFLQGFNAPPG